MKPSRTLLMVGLPALLLGLTTPAAGQAAVQEEAQEEAERVYAQGLRPFFRGNLEAALKNFLAAARADPGNFRAVYLAGAAYGKSGRYSEALPFLERAVQLRPDYSPARLAAAVALYHLGRLQEALSAIDVALRHDPDNGLGHYYRGLTLFRQNDYEAAQAAFQSAAQRDPFIRAISHQYTALCHLAGDDSPGAAKSFYEAALAYEFDAKLPEARTAFELAATLDPDASFANQARQRSEEIYSKLRRDEGKRWQCRLSLGYEADSNVILQPEGGPALGQVTDKEDSRFVFTGTATLDLLRGESGKLTAGYDFLQSLHTEVEDFNVQVHVGRLVGVWNLGDRARVGLEGGIGHYLLGQESYLQEPYVRPFAGFFLSSRHYTRASYTFSDRNFRSDVFDPIRDGVRHEAQVRHYFLLDEFRSYVFGGYGFADENPDSAPGNDFQYRSHLFGGGARLPVSERLTAEAAYWYRSDGYDFPHSRTGFTVPRDDQVHQFTVSVHRALNRRLDLRVSYVGTINNSNIAVFDYDRHVVSGGLEFVF